MDKQSTHLPFRDFDLTRSTVIPNSSPYFFIKRLIVVGSTPRVSAISIKGTKSDITYSPLTPNAPVQRRTAQRAVRCNRLLGGAPVPNPYWISASEQTRLQPRIGVEHRRLGRLAERDLVGAAGDIHGHVVTPIDQTRAPSAARSPSTQARPLTCRARPDTSPR